VICISGAGGFRMEDLRIYNGEEAWIVLVDDDKTYWWSVRLIGFLQDSGEEENNSYFMKEDKRNLYHDDTWYMCYLDDEKMGGLSSVQNYNYVGLVVGRKPTVEDALSVTRGEIIDSFGGELKEILKSHVKPKQKETKRRENKG
jgi:hypothetical protein